MKAIKGRMIVKFDLHQKDKVTFGTLKLYVPNRADVNENMREGYPTLSTVVDGGETELKEGDVIVSEHTLLENTGQWIENIDGIVTMSIPIKSDVVIYGKIDEKGDVIPLFDNLVCERIQEGFSSSIIITPDIYKKVENNKAIVLRVSKNSDIKEGEKIVYYRYSDYELVYFIDGIERKAIMVKRSDIVGIEK